MSQSSTLFISFIIVAKEKSEIVKSIAALKKIIPHPHINFETITAFGNHPSNQRNKAAQIAEGKYLHFLDNDSECDPLILHYLYDAIVAYGSPDVIGGPSVFENKSDFFEHTLSLLLSSPLAIGPSSSRYIPLGTVRKSGEKELILCNMCVKRSLFLESNGFDLRLYPNEENEFLNRINSFADVLYHPLVVVRRSPPSSFKSFIRQMLYYGRGRIRHFIILKRFEFIYFIPALFSLYILSLPLFSFKTLFVFFPLAIYLLFALVTTFTLIIFEERKKFFLLLSLFFTCHFFYGLGILTWFRDNYRIHKMNSNLKCLLEKIELHES